MDADSFDDLLRTLSTAPSRRGLARAFGAATLTGLLGSLLNSADLAAKRKKKKKCKASKGLKKCGKKCIPLDSCCTSADCGSGGACAGGACICAIGFRSCRGGCLPDTACCADGDCGRCEVCQGGACVSGCPVGQACVGGQCRCTASSCAGCCDAETCLDGKSNAACGDSGKTCVPCTDGRNCQGGTCVCPDECCSSADCAAGQICLQKQCITGQGTCGAGDNSCLFMVSVTCNGRNDCWCYPDRNGNIHCAIQLAPNPPCQSDADCAQVGPGAFCTPTVDECDRGSGAGYCTLPCPT